MNTPIEAVIEDATLNWMGGLGWCVICGPYIALDTLLAERCDNRQVILERLVD